MALFFIWCCQHELVLINMATATPLVLFKFQLRFVDAVELQSDFICYRLNYRRDRLEVMPHTAVTCSKHAPVLTAQLR